MRFAPGVVPIVVCASLLSPAVPAAALDDATILAVFDQANMADIWTGRLGVKRAHSQEVRELARMVAVDHESVQHMTREVAKQLGIVPTPPDNDTSIDSQAKAVAMLQSKSDAEFDRAYLRHELAFHRAAIDAVKTTLLPAAKSEALKTLLRESLPGFEHHLAATEAVAKKYDIPLKP